MAGRSSEVQVSGRWTGIQVHQDLDATVHSPAADRQVRAYRPFRTLRGDLDVYALKQLHRRGQVLHAFLEPSAKCPCYRHRTSETDFTVLGRVPRLVLVAADSTTGHSGCELRAIRVSMSAAIFAMMRR